jgi:PRTRC genetic system protein E
MTLFEELFALAKTATLTLAVSADEASGRMTVNVMPRPRKDVAEPVLSQPLSLTATPAEFDSGFVEALRGYCEVRLSLARQAETTLAALEAAKATSVKKAGAATGRTAGKGSIACAKSSPVVPANSDSGDAGCAPPSHDDAGDTSEPAQPQAGESFDLFG